jgi:hypothetical protein
MNTKKNAIMAFAAMANYYRLLQAVTPKTICSGLKC